MCAPFTRALALDSRTTRASLAIRFLVLPTDPTSHHALTPMFSSTSALFAHNGDSQPLSPQSLSHSFPFNGGGSLPFFLLFFTTHHLRSLHPASLIGTRLLLFSNLPLYFQSLAGCPSRNPFPFMLLHRCPGVGTPIGVPERKLRQVARANQNGPIQFGVASKKSPPYLILDGLAVRSQYFESV